MKTKYWIEGLTKYWTEGLSEEEIKEIKELANLIINAARGIYFLSLEERAELIANCLIKNGYHKIKESE